jgi:DNA-binding LytR/AlgR family response regulator
MNATALIAEDEPLLAQALQAELARAWPALQVLACVGDGASAVEQALTLRPQVLFLDIRMPALSGIDAAAAIADDWPPERALPVLVFVTAHDQFAVQAFEAQALDYVLKPVQPERLQRTVARVQAALQARGESSATATPLDADWAGLRALLQAGAPPAPARLRHLMVGVGAGSTAAVERIAIDAVLAFDAADKYLRVLTAEREYLIRVPLKDVLPQLDPEVFWQIHRGTVARADAIHRVTRDEAGKWRLTLSGLSEAFGISRLYADRFRAM